ncbi:YjcZ family sporulation protein [Pseudalkalibacillus sp. SCS-8]
MSDGYKHGGSFALIVVLFILLIIIGVAACGYCYYDGYGYDGYGHGGYGK